MVCVWRAGVLARVPVSAYARVGVCDGAGKGAGAGAGVGARWLIGAWCVVCVCVCVGAGAQRGVQVCTCESATVHMSACGRSRVNRASDLQEEHDLKIQARCQTSDSEIENPCCFFPIGNQRKPTHVIFTGPPFEKYPSKFAFSPNQKRPWLFLGLAHAGLQNCMPWIETLRTSTR